MIDLSALNLAVSQRTAPGDKRDQADAATDDGGHGRKFGDFVKEADARHQAQSTTTDSRSKFANVAANDDLALLADAKGDALLAVDDNLDATSQTAADAASPQAGATAPDTGAADGSRQAKMRLTAMQAQAKAADAATAGTEDKADAAETAADHKNMQILNKFLNAATSANTATTPAQELRALLELATTDGAADDDGVTATDGRKARHGTTADDASEADATSADDVPTVATEKTGTQNQTAIQHAVAILGGEVGQAGAVKGGQASAQQTGDTSKVTLVSLDGKSPSADAVTTEAATDSSSEAAAGNKTDFVTVLEARRYLGFSTDSAAGVSANANALTDAVKGDANWAQVIQSVKNGTHTTATEVNTLKLQMSPEHLGNMTASLRLKGEELSVEVRVETADAYRQLTQDQDGIVKALKQHGFSIDQVSIQLSPAARADGGQMGGDPNQAGSNAQNMQDGSQGETARQREESARRNANQSNWTGNDGTSTFTDTGSSADDSASGNLYL
jgi:chemotaxis protein MotD